MLCAGARRGVGQEMSASCYTTGRPRTVPTSMHMPFDAAMRATAATPLMPLVINSRTARRACGGISDATAPDIMCRSGRWHRIFVRAPDVYRMNACTDGRGPSARSHGSRHVNWSSALAIPTTWQRDDSSSDNSNSAYCSRKSRLMWKFTYLTVSTVLASSVAAF